MALDLDAILDGLTPKERDFCLFYVGEANFVAMKAAEMAGYATPHSEGSRIIRREHVADAIGRLMAARNAGLAVDAKWVLIRLVEVEHDAAIHKSRKDRLRALELIGRHVDVRAFREQLGLSGPNGEALNPNLPLETLTAEELDALEAISRKLYGAAAANSAALSYSGGTGAPEGSG